MNPYVELMRPWQWYKNLLIFMPMLFSGAIFNAAAMAAVVAGFAALCVMSSSTYVINDLMDVKADKIHPKKRKRPLPSGRARAATASIFAVVLYGVASAASLALSWMFFAMAQLLFFLTLAYSLHFKHVAFVDVQFISVNFVIRAISGVFILHLPWSMWLFIVVYLLALFWALGKRYSEVTTLADSGAHRKANALYSRDLLKSMSNIVCAMLLISYLMYILSTGRMLMLATAPISVFAVFRYLYLVYAGSDVAQNSEKVFLDGQMLAAMLLWVMIILASVILTV